MLMSSNDKLNTAIPLSSIVHKSRLSQEAYYASDLSIRRFRKLVKAHLFADSWDGMILCSEAAGLKMALYSGGRQIRTGDDFLMAICVPSTTPREQKLETSIMFYVLERRHGDA